MKWASEYRNRPVVNARDYKNKQSYQMRKTRNRIIKYVVLAGLIAFHVHKCTSDNGKESKLEKTINKIEYIKEE